MYPPLGVIPFIVVGYTRSVCERAWNVWERTYERIPDASERIQSGQDIRLRRADHVGSFPVM